MGDKTKTLPVIYEARTFVQRFGISRSLISMGEQWRAVIREKHVADVQRSIPLGIVREDTFTLKVLGDDELAALPPEQAPRPGETIAVATVTGYDLLGLEA